MDGLEFVDDYSDTDVCTTIPKCKSDSQCKSEGLEANLKQKPAKGYLDEKGDLVQTSDDERTVCLRIPVSHSPALRLARCPFSEKVQDVYMRILSRKILSLHS